MASNEERREVARRLRRIPEKGDAVAFDIIVRQLGLEPHPDYEYCAVYTPESVMRIAELIEPEQERTCRNVGEGDCFTCSSCGGHAITSDDQGVTMWPAGGSQRRSIPFHCPICGAKVVNQ